MDEVLEVFDVVYYGILVRVFVGCGLWMKKGVGFGWLVGCRCVVKLVISLLICWWLLLVLIMW